MGAERFDDDSYPRYEQQPKLILVGRIVGTVDGRPWTIGGDGRVLTLELSSLSVAFVFRSTFSRLPSDVLRALSVVEVPLRVRVGSLPAVTIGQRSFLRRFLVGGRKAARKSL